MKMTLLLLLYLPFGAAADDANPDGFITREAQIVCNESVCMAPKSEILWLIRSNEELVARLKAAEDKLAKNPPQCAKTEVTEPSKNAPPPKPIPPIKTERYS